MDVNTVYPEHIDNIYHAIGKHDINGCLVFSGRKPLETDSWDITITGDQNAPLPETSSYHLIPAEGISEIAFDLGAIYYTEADSGKVITIKYARAVRCRELQMKKMVYVLL